MSKINKRSMYYFILGALVIYFSVVTFVDNKPERIGARLIWIGVILLGVFIFDFIDRKKRS